MNESVEFAGGPELMRNSLIFTGLTFRTFSAAVSDSFAPVGWLVHEALPTRSPFSGVGPEVTLKVALTLAPGTIGSSKIFAVSAAPATTDVHCSLGTEMLKLRPTAGTPVVFVNVTVVSCDDPGEKIWSPVGAELAEA